MGTHLYMKVPKMQEKAMERVNENSPNLDWRIGKVRPTTKLLNQLVAPPNAMPTDRGPTGNSSEVDKDFRWN